MNSVDVVELARDVTTMREEVRSLLDRVSELERVGELEYGRLVTERLRRAIRPRAVGVVGPRTASAGTVLAYLAHQLSACHPRLADVARDAAIAAQSWLPSDQTQWELRCPRAD